MFTFCKRLSLSLGKLRTFALFNFVVGNLKKINSSIYLKFLIGVFNGTLSIYVTRFPYETYNSTWPGFRSFRSGKSEFSNRWFRKWNFVECKVETVSLRFATLAFDVALASQCECHLDPNVVNWMEVTKKNLNK